MAALRIALLTVIALRTSASTLPVDSQALEPRVAGGTCNPGDEVEINAHFYGLPPDYQPSYAPFTLTHTGGSEGCEYIANSYTPCMANDLEDYDPNCLCVSLPQPSVGLCADSRRW